MVETLSLKNAFPFKIAQKIEKEVRNLASDPPPPFQLTNSMSCAQVSNIEMGEGVKENLKITQKRSSVSTPFESGCSSSPKLKYEYGVFNAGRGGEG